MTASPHAHDCPTARACCDAARAQLAERREDGEVDAGELAGVSTSWLAETTRTIEAEQEV